MNERIKAIHDRSQQVVGHTDGGYTEIKALDADKFAYLIIQECANFTDPVTRNLMLQHFGINL